MPLIRCPDCGTEVSDQAAACPKCARPIKAQPVRTQYVGTQTVRTRPATSPATWGCLTLILAVVGVGLIGRPGSDGTPPVQPRGYAEREAAAQKLGLSEGAASNMWTAAYRAGFIDRYECDGTPAYCVMMADSAEWAELSRDSIRSFMTNAGRGAAVVYGATSVHIHNARTGDRMVSYTAGDGSVYFHE